MENKEFHEFHIKIYCVIRCLLAFFLPIFVFMIYYAFYFPWYGTVATILYFAFAIFISACISYYTGSAKVKIVYTKEAFLHIWKTKYLFCRENDIKIPWEIVDNYDVKDRSFIINLTNKKRYNIGFFRDKYLCDFALQFDYLSNHYRSQNNPNLPVIGLAKPKKFYKTEEFLMGIICMGLVLLQIFNKYCSG